MLGLRRRVDAGVDLLRLRHLRGRAGPAPASAARQHQRPARHRDVPAVPAHRRASRCSQRASARPSPMPGTTCRPGAAVCLERGHQPLLRREHRGVAAVRRAVGRRRASGDRPGSSLPWLLVPLSTAGWRGSSWSRHPSFVIGVMVALNEINIAARAGAHGSRCLNGTGLPPAGQPLHPRTGGGTRPHGLSTRRCAACGASGRVGPPTVGLLGDHRQRHVVKGPPLRDGPSPRTGGGTRTHTPFRTKHFECSASAIPPHRPRHVRERPYRRIQG